MFVDGQQVLFPHLHTRQQLQTLRFVPKGYFGKMHIQGVLMLFSLLTVGQRGTIRTYV